MTLSTSNRPGVLVTGAARGIGRACVTVLTQRGLHVFAGVRSPEDTGALAEVEHVTPLPLDVTDRAQVDAAAESVGRALAGGRLAGVVNNAGILMSGPLEHQAVTSVRRQLDVNVLGPLQVVQAFLPQLRASGGRIVNLGSTSAHSTGRFVGAYAGSKAALDTMSSALRLELADAGVAVCVVEPAAVATTLWDRELAAQGVWTADLPSAGRDYYGSRVAARGDRLGQLGRAGADPEEVARAVAEALLVPRPRPRIYVGRRARLLALAERGLPERLIIRLRS